MNVLFVDKISKRFGRSKVLDEISFSIEKGEVVGLVGRSGAGKSVLIKILVGFYKPDEGFVAVNSGSLNPVGYSMQDNALYDQLTVRQNLKYFSEIHKMSSQMKNDRIKMLIDKLDLKDYPDILIKNLSGGTKKRVDIACALLTDPDVIIFDEPFLGLDPVLTDALSSFIMSLSKLGKTILVSSHRTEELSKICTRLMMLKSGKLYQITKSQMREVY
ncbi:MAG: ABC transporter ATP-binding protein [archaeon]